MTRVGYLPYEPQLTAVAQTENVWTVEGPEVSYRLGGVVIPCPTRMTVIKLIDGTLLLHSPVKYTSALDREIKAFGPVSALIAPNSYHYLHVRAWTSVHPNAAVYASPDIAQKIELAGSIPLSSSAPALWSRDLAQSLIALGKFHETIFFHRPSRTLIVTDLMQTFEASRVRSLFIRMLLKVGGATGPNARPSIEIRLAAYRHRNALLAGVQQMIQWNPQRIILAHGPCIQSNAIANIKSAFTWVDRFES